MESIIACRIITVISSFTQVFAMLCFVQEPPSVLYASSGSTARQVWDYNAKNRSEVFDPLSPDWNFYNKTGSRLRIGVDNGYSNWKFVINEECPTRLRGRVSREFTATLVISNVTSADSGIYGCNLVLLSGSPIKSRVHLIVRDRPRFNNTFNLTTSVIEGSSLHVHCSASANPVPNVTWVRIMEIPIFINTGVGRVFLTFSNITRHQSGSYECQATNNPNEDTVTTRTKISVKSAKASTLNERLGAIDGAKRQKVFAGVIGVVIWVGLMGTVVVLVCIKKRCSRRGKDQTNVRFAGSTLDKESTDAIALATLEQSTANIVLAKNTSKSSQNEDYDDITEKSDSSTDWENATRGANESDAQHPQTHHDYQELDTNAFSSNTQDYQALKRNQEDCATEIKPSQNEDYDDITEASDSSTDWENATRGARESDAQHPQTHHDYQELDIMLSRQTHTTIKPSKRIKRIVLQK